MMRKEEEGGRREIEGEGKEKQNGGRREEGVQ